ncbi:MAG: hypothetical protein Kow00114_35800 [Kiloniellaceae bacterium]
MKSLLADAGLALLLPPAAAQAGEADVVAAEAARESDGTWRFRVTVRHADEGWNHYADRWQVETPEGRVLGTRVLLHPHETEQPFTRALGGVVVPEGVTEVVIRAHDSVHGDGGRTYRLTLPRQP